MTAKRRPPRRAAGLADAASDAMDRVFLPWKSSAPLAARMRPRTLDEYVGQEHILGPGKLLRRAIEADRIGSILLWGPPGSGKTTLARVIAGATRSRFETLNAVLAGVKDIREVVARARERLDEEPDLLEGPRRTTLFVDEVHRFNKAQQDALLPHVENGTVTFIGATTENPYFEVIKPLVSRSRIFELRPLDGERLRDIALHALADVERGYGARDVVVDKDALDHLTDMAQGDARNLLNALELAVETTPPGADGVVRITQEVAEESIQRRALLYDKDGDAHYDTISAFIKSLRGSDPDAALYWLAKMVRAGEDPRFIARRLVIFASEDVGLADSRALSVATSAAGAVEFVGLPECQWNLAHATIYLATAPKSNSAMGYFEALRSLEQQGDDEVPNPLKDATRDREGLGHGKGYKYPHAFREHWVPQQYLPDSLQGARFYTPGELGEEAAIRERVERLRELQQGGLEEARRIDEVSSGRERRRRAQLEEHGKRRVELRDRILERAEIGLDHAVLDIGGRPGLMAWGALELAPLGRAHALASDAATAARIRQAASAASVDRILEVSIGELDAIPGDESSFDRILGAGALHDRDRREEIPRELLRVLRDGGRVVLQEPLLGETRPLSADVDLRALGEATATRIREAEEAIYRDAGDPRMRLTAEELAADFERAGFVDVVVERTLDTVRRAITADDVVRWFSARWFSAVAPDGREGFEARLLRRLSPDEVAAFKRALEDQLVGRTVGRPLAGLILTAGKAARQG